jgi:hypothetical protein
MTALIHLPVQFQGDYKTQIIPFNKNSKTMKTRSITIRDVRRPFTLMLALLMATILFFAKKASCQSLALVHNVTHKRIMISVHQKISLRLSSDHSNRSGRIIDLTDSTITIEENNTQMKYAFKNIDFILLSRHSARMAGGAISLANGFLAVVLGIAWSNAKDKSHQPYFGPMFETKIKKEMAPIFICVGVVAIPTGIVLLSKKKIALSKWSIKTDSANLQP